MRKRVILISLVSLAVMVVVLTRKEEKMEVQPAPTIIVQKKKGGENHLARKQWYEQMHMAAPGDDWREIDNENRAVLRTQRAQLRRMKTSNTEVIADGILTGNWTEKGANNVAGRMHNIDIDFENNILYGSSDGGQIWRADPDGKNWVSLSDHYHVKGAHFLRFMTLDSGATRIMQISGDSLFMYSDNDGIDWQISSGLDAMKNDRCIRAVTNVQEHIYLLFLRSNQRSFIYKSTDKGNNFELVLDNQPSSRYTDIWMSRYEESDLYFLDRTDIYAISDDGEISAAMPVSINFSSSEIEGCQMNGAVANENTHIAIMYRIKNNSRFVTSNNGGQSWQVKGTVSEGPFMSNSFGMSNNNPDIMGMGGVNAYRSFDGGKTWEMINGWGEYYGDIVNKLHADIPEIEFLRKPDGSEMVVISTDGGSYISNDDLRSVKNISLTTLRNAQYYSTYTHRTNHQVIYAGSQDQGFQRTTEITDGVAHFEQTISGDYGHIVSGDGGKSLWTVYPGFAMYYPDAAGSNHLSMWSFTGQNHLWMPPLMADPYFPERVFLAGGTSTTGSHLWVLEYKNNTINVTELPYDFGGTAASYITSMAYSPINKDYRYVLNGSGKLYYSTDRGVNWAPSRTSGPGSHYFYGNSIIPDPRDINTIYLGGSGYSGYAAWKSTDGGNLFKGIGKGLPRTLIFEMAINETGTLLFAATEVGPFVYIVDEDQWYDLAGSSAPEQTYWTVDYIPALRTARFGTYGRGIWDFKIEHFDKIGTGIDNDLWVNPARLELYPNPSSGPVTIRYYLDQALAAEISVHDMSGKQVQHEMRPEEDPGLHEVMVDLSHLPAGMYFVRIQKGQQVQIEKLIRQ